LKILLADKDIQRASQYKVWLVKNGHAVVLSHTGFDCVKNYRQILRAAHKNKNTLLTPPPFDVVIIGDNMPDSKAVDIAKKIFSFNPYQRVILTSNDILSTFYDALRQLRVSIEVLQYPVSSTTLVSRVQGSEFQDRLNKMNSRIKVSDY
jgi:DNA-binding NarL/FixJ family response regulator